MTRAMAMVQQGALPDGTLKSLEGAIQALYRQHIQPDARLRFVWISIPPGQAFVAGRPSRSNTLQMPVPDGTPDDQRHGFMAAVCAHWMEETGCAEDELVLSVPDQSYAAQFLAHNSRRIAGPGAMRARMGVAWHLLNSKLRRGVALMSINLKSAA